MESNLRRSHCRIVTGTLTLILFALPHFLIAQTSTATLLGVVRDSSGAVILNATVTASNLDTGLVRTTVSNHLGYYEIPLLPIGRYSLLVEHPGFKKFTQTNIGLAQDQKATIDLTLEVGAPTETVTVRSSAPMVNATTTETGGTLTERKILELPLLSRNWTNLVLLQPGVTPTTSGGAWKGFSLNGGAFYGMNFTMDGTDMSNVTVPGLGGFLPSLVTPLVNTIGLDNIAEIKTTNGVYTAATGRSVSGGLNIITKSGTNLFHGTLFEFLQNDALNARNFFATGVPPNKVSQFGGNMGGPIVRDKLFFFFGYEGARLRKQSVQQTLVPTQAFRQSLRPVLQPIWEDVPLPNTPNPPGFSDPNLGYFRLQAPPTDREDHGNIRFDYQISKRQTAFLRYNLNNVSNVVYRFGLPKNIYRVMNVSQIATLGHTFSISSKAMNELRLGFDRLKYRAIVSGGTAGDIDVVVCVNTLACNGQGGGKGNRSAANSLTVADNLSYQSGRHFLKTGVEIRRPEDNRIDHDPKYSITYNSIPDFLANNIYQTVITFGNDGIGFRQYNFGVYIEDGFRISPRLTLNLGLRYEKNTVFKERYGRLYNVISDPFGGFRPAGAPIYSPDNNNWQPRGGLAYAPSWSPKTVIRTGFGVYNQPIVPIQLWYYIGNPAAPTRSTVNGSPLGGIPLSYPLPSNIDAFGLNPVYGSRYGLDPNIRDPYSLQWCFDLQHQLSAATALEVGYYGNRGLKNYQQNILNTIDPVTGKRPDPNLGAINWGENADMTSYHGLQAKFTHRYSRGLTYDFYYTYSKTMEVGLSEQFSGGARVQDHNNIRADRSLSAHDLTHVFTYDFQYELPVGQGKAFLSGTRGIAGKLLEGWNFTGLGNFQSGSPLNIVSGSDIAGTGAGTQRANIVSGVPIYTGITGPNMAYLNRAAFALPTKGQFGNLGRFTARGPGTWSSSLALLKNTKIAERYTVQFRFESFDWLNHPVWGNPNANRASSSFGLITSASGNRQIQFGLKLLW